jgi:hypothetical protein
MHASDVRWRAHRGKHTDPARAAAQLPELSIDARAGGRAPGMRACGSVLGLILGREAERIRLSTKLRQNLTNATVLGDPLHRDRGRMDVTGDPDHAFKFHVLTLRHFATTGFPAIFPEQR